MNEQQNKQDLSVELAKQIIKEMYVYTRLMRKAQVNYFSTKMMIDLQTAKVLESLLDTKIAMISKILKAHDLPYFESCIVWYEDILRNRSVKQVDLFKADSK